MGKVELQDQLEKLKALNASDLKFFFAVASLSWKIKSVEWKYDINENLELSEKLEEAGLVTITLPATSTSLKGNLSSLSLLNIIC